MAKLFLDLFILKSIMTIATMWPQPIEILRYYKQALEAINALRRVVSPSLGVGGGSQESEFYGMTNETFDQELRNFAKELDHEVVMMLAASFEAIIQVDFHNRVAKRLKDSISKEFRRLYYKVSSKRWKWIDTDFILEVWKKETGHKEIIGHFKMLMLYRHWIAHGRYWVQRSGLANVDPFEAWNIGQAIFAGLPGFPPLTSK